MRVPNVSLKPLTPLQPLPLVFSHFLSYFFSSACPVPERTPLLGVGILHHAIDLPPFVIFGEILGNR